jgi:glycosyltransferase involved in cell wall biosynthesis
VLNSNFKTTEILLIDDCSVESGLEDFLDWTKQFPNVLYFRLAQNSGPGIARNKGIERATGKWIFFLDSDDVIYHDKLSLLIDFLETEKADIIFLTSKNVCKPNSAVHTDNFPKKTLNPFDDIVSYYVYNCYVFHFVYLRKFLIEKRILFNDFYFGEDICFTLTALCMTENIGMCDILFYEHHYLSSESIVNSSHTRSSYYNRMISTRKAVYATIKQLYLICEPAKKNPLGLLLKRYIFYPKITDINDNSLLDIEREAFDEFRESIKQYLQDKRKIYISTAQDAGQTFIRLCESLKIKLAGYLDNNPDSLVSIAEKKAGINVLKLTDYKKDDSALIVVFGWNRNVITEQLVNMNYENGKDFITLDYF